MKNQNTTNQNGTAPTHARHTTTPWFVDPTDSEGRTVSACADGSGAIAECGLDYSTLERKPGRADAARIVACVNACAGLADPAAVPDLLAALEKCAWVLAECSVGKDKLADLFPKKLEQARAAIARATAGGNGGAL